MKFGATKNPSYRVTTTWKVENNWDDCIPS